MNEEMNLKIDLSRLSKEERDEFKRLTEKASREDCESRVWKPECGEHYFTIEVATCAIIEAIWVDRKIDRFRWTIGFVFKTQEEAEFALGKMMVKTELERYAREHNDPNREKWDRGSYYKIVYSENENKMRIDFDNTLNSESTTYFTSEKIVNDAVKEIGEKRIMKYLFGVDCEEDE